MSEEKQGYQIAAQAVQGWSQTSRCSVCGAGWLDDHAADCTVLSALRSRYYPAVVDQNGMPSDFNSLRKKDQRITELERVVSFWQRQAAEYGRLAGELRAEREELRRRLAELSEPPKPVDPFVNALRHSL